MRSCRSLILLVVLILVAGCAASDVGKALQASEGAKLAVESAADEVIRLHERKELSDSNYAQARAAYEKWAKAQTVYTESFVAWTRSKTAANDARVQAALSNLGPAMTAALDTLCSFKTASNALTQACASGGR